MKQRFSTNVALEEQSRYFFKHALIQDIAYQSLLKSHTTALSPTDSAGIGRTIFRTNEAQPELLAHHYTEAGLIERAIPYWRIAGQVNEPTSGRLMWKRWLHTHQGAGSA